MKNKYEVEWSGKWEGGEQRNEGKYDTHMENSWLWELINIGMI